MQGLESLRVDELVRAIGRELEAEGVECWLVGGAVRDSLAGRPGPHDIDLVVPSGAFGIARRLADAFGGSFVALDEARDIARVVVGEEGERREIDVAALRGPFLEDDLRLRDFTVNAIALDLAELMDAKVISLTIHDPTGGRQDLHAGVIRTPSAKVLDDDPLRLLRAVRIAAELGFAIEPETRKAIVKRAKLLEGVARERVRDELFNLLAVEPSWPWIEETVSLGLLEVVAPEHGPMVDLDQGRHHEATLWAHSLSTLRHLEDLFGRMDSELPDDSADIEAYLAQPMEANIDRRVLMKWAALWHDIGKPDTMTVEVDGEISFLGHEKLGADMMRSMSRRLRLGRRETAFLSGVVAHHLRPLHLSKTEKVTRRACYRFFRDVKDAARAVCLVALADARATRERGETATDVEGVVRKLLAYRREQPAEAASPLVEGGELMECLGLDGGPLVGRLMTILEEARASGEISTKEEALTYLEARRDEWE